MAKIMVVDDAAFMRMRMKNLLQENGHQVLEAENGKAAVELYQREKPDLVFMDITMPEMDGLEALQKIRGSDPGAKVIMCSALGQQSVVIQAVKNGAKDFVVKPFEPDKIITTVKKHL